jgi:peroxiredoxin
MVLRKFQVIACLALVSTVWASDLPRKAPNLALHLHNGKDLPVSQFHGKLIALAFISTTCPHCQHYTQALSVIQKDYAARGVQILAAAFNDDAKVALPGFIQQFQPNFPVGWEDRTSALSFLQISVLNQGYVPKVVFIDRAGVIQKQFEGQDDFFRDPDKNTRATLDEMLKAPAAGAAHKKTVAKK